MFSKISKVIKISGKIQIRELSVFLVRTYYIYKIIIYLFWAEKINIQFGDKISSRIPI
jgi:hypothetical protein